MISTNILNDSINTDQNNTNKEDINIKEDENSNKQNDYNANKSIYKKNQSLKEDTIYKNEQIKSKDKSKKSDYISNGDLLEYRLRRLIFFMGYFPRVGVIIKSSNDEQADMITDLDVYGFYIHKNFASKTIWVDCKSGQARPLERISWILGVKNIIGIEEVIFVKRGVRIATKQFARKSGIQVLDLEVINKLERDYKIIPNDWRGSWNPYIQLNQLVTFQKINVPTNETFKKIGKFISCSYWTFNNYIKIKKTITALKQLAEIEQYPLQQEQIKSVHWAIFELINLFVLATLNVSKELYYFSDKDKKDTILDGLISGEISANKRTEIVNATYRIIYNIIRQQIPDFDAPLKIPNLGSEPPKYFEAFYNLILKITNNPLDYFDILRFLDFMFMEYDLQSKKIDEEVFKKMLPNYDNLVISAKTILHFICSVTEIRKDMFQLIKYSS